jgi:hypothetical protein
VVDDLDQDVVLTRFEHQVDFAVAVEVGVVD